MANSATYNRTKIHFAEGSAPTTPDTGEWVVYAKTTGLFVMDDAGVEYGPFGSGDAAAHIADASDAHDASAISIADVGAHFTGTDVEAALQELGAAGSGSGGFTQNVDEAGPSFAAFTSQSGSWASAGGVIQQTDTTPNVTRRARVTAIQPFGAGAIIEAEIRLPSAGQIAGTNLAGLSLGSVDGVVAAMLTEGSGVGVERDAVANVRTLTTTIALDTWYKLRIAHLSRIVSIFLDGTHLGSQGVNPGEGASEWLGLRTFNAIADYRNIKAWTLTLPA